MATLSIALVDSREVFIIIAIKARGKCIRIIGTAHCLYTRYVETGDVSPKKASDERPSCDDLHELYIIGPIHMNPAIYLHEN